MCCCAFFSYLSLTVLLVASVPVCKLLQAHFALHCKCHRLIFFLFEIKKNKSIDSEQQAAYKTFSLFFLTLVILRCSAVTLHLSRWCWLYFEWDSCYHTQLILINLYLAKMIKMKRKKKKKQIKNKHTECGDQKNVLSEIKCDRMLCLCYSIGKKNAWHTHAQYLSAIYTVILISKISSQYFDVYLHKTHHLNGTVVCVYLRGFLCTRDVVQIDKNHITFFIIWFCTTYDLRVFARIFVIK